MRAEGVRDRPHVGARADAQIEADDPSGIRDDVERVDPGAAERHLHRDAAAGEPVRALTTDLHRRGGRDRQIDLTAEGGEPALELVLPGGGVPSSMISPSIASRRARSRSISVR